MVGSATAADCSARIIFERVAAVTRSRVPIVAMLVMQGQRDCRIYGWGAVGEKAGFLLDYRKNGTCIDLFKEGLPEKGLLGLRVWSLGGAL